jgi:hypothetical protein
MSTFRLLHQLSAENQRRICDHLSQEIAPHLSPDSSSYASGRSRLWLQHQPSFARDYTLSAGHVDQRLWGYFERLLPSRIDCGLVTRGPVGISMHRDASYAQYRAFGVNLGEQVTFGYREVYREYRYSPDQQAFAPVQEITLQPGDVYEFCCKNPHGIMSPITASRWSINFWALRSR